MAATNRLLRVSLDAQGIPTINAPTAPLAPGAASPIIRIQLRDPNDPTDVDDPQDLFGGQESARPRHQLDGHARLRDGLPLAGRGRRRHLGKRSDQVQDAAADALGRACRGRVATDEIVQRGKYLFNTSIGPVGNGRQLQAARGTDVGLRLGLVLRVPPRGALADSVTWMFADGPRQTISMESTFPFGQAVIENGAPKLPDSHQRALNWSAIRDSVQDFERNIRAVSGGGGLIREGFAEGAAGLVNIPDFLCGAAPSPPCKTPNTGRDPDLDAIATYLALGVRAPISPVSAGVVKKGRALFETAGCQTCHGGPNWTNQHSRFRPAARRRPDRRCPAQSSSSAGWAPSIRRLFTDPVSNEIRANNAANVQARGLLGFNPPSLIAVFNSAPYLHSGAAPTLDAVLENVTHRTVGRADKAWTPSPTRVTGKRWSSSSSRSTAPQYPSPPARLPAGVCGP